MQFAHTLEKRKVLNVLRLDFVGQRVVVFALAEATFIFRLGRSIIGQMMLVGNGLHLCGHFFDLRMGQGLNAEVVIFLKLVLDNVMATVESGNNILVKNLIARQLQKIKCADCIVALVFMCFKPLSYLFGKFVVHLRGSILIWREGSNFI